MFLVVFSLCALLLAGAIENYFHQRALRKIPLRILVNGTRGKTTVARMTASALNGAGIRTWAKTTGSQARRILPDGREQAYRRESRPANIMEQLPFVRLAARDDAQAIVVECMAQRIDNQFLFADKLIRPNFVLMTNTFVDHIEEIGATEEETIRVLAQSIPHDSRVIAHNPRFGTYTDHLILANGQADLSRLCDCPFPIHEENVQLLLALADELHIPHESMYNGIRNTAPDIGMVKEVRVGTLRVRNAFAANDPVSFMQALDDCAGQGDYVLLYNHRRDRAYRLETFAKAIRESDRPPLRIGVIGENKKWAAQYMQRATQLHAEAVSDPVGFVKQTPDASQVLCAGNIKGEGCRLLEELMKEEHKHV